MGVGGGGGGNREKLRDIHKENGDVVVVAVVLLIDIKIVRGHSNSLKSKEPSPLLER